MNNNKTLEIVNKIFVGVFDKKCRYNLEEILEKFAFDIKLPKQVNDSLTNEVTWADSINSGKFITLNNMEERDKIDGWILQKKEIRNMQDIMNVWNSINYTTTERVYDSINVSHSDTIYSCENIYRCTDCTGSKNLVYCDSCFNSEFLVASSRSANCLFSIRCDDSKSCSNSYNVICSNKVKNSFFIQDCFDLDECMFCSHIASRKYCIANMQFEEEEYFEIKKNIIDWIINS